MEYGSQASCWPGVFIRPGYFLDYSSISRRSKLLLTFRRDVPASAQTVRSCGRPSLAIGFRSLLVSQRKRIHGVQPHPSVSAVCRVGHRGCCLLTGSQSVRPYAPPIMLRFRRLSPLPRNSPSERRQSFCSSIRLKLYRNGGKEAAIRALAATFTALRFGRRTNPSVYFASAALVLASSIVRTSLSWPITTG